MELKTKHIINRESREISFLVYGVIGEKIDGDYLARELQWVDREYDVVTLRINSDGGYVTQGLSIVSQLIQMRAKTVAQIDGVAASMAAIIPAACDVVKMNDYARMMIHAPFMVDDKMKAVKMSEKDRKSAAAMKGILIDLLNKRGKSKEDIDSLMTAETWFTADEALANGLVDEIVDTGRKKELASYAPLQLVACVDKEVFTNTNSNMKQICAKLGLPETSDEAAILAKMGEQETAQADRQTKLVDRYLELGRKSGAVTDENVDKMRRLAAADFDLFVDMMKPEQAEQAGGRITDHIVNLGKQGGAKPDEKDFDWFQKNDPAALRRMEISEPDRFKKLMDAYNAQFV